MSRFENLDLDQALRLITEETAGETGTNFYSALVKALATTLNTSGAWITEYLEELARLRSSRTRDLSASAIVVEVENQENARRSTDRKTQKLYTKLQNSGLLPIFWTAALSHRHSRGLKFFSFKQLRSRTHGHASCAPSFRLSLPSLSTHSSKRMH
jgi:hypothetical protein